MRVVSDTRILTEQQSTRFRQILWQQRGARAFLDPVLVEALQLRPPQREAILTILQETRKKVGAVTRGDPRSEENQVDIEGFREEALGKSLQVLSDEQKQRWEELRGALFAFGPGPTTSSGTGEIE
jgi:hypothetical protein